MNRMMTHVLAAGLIAAGTIGICGDQLEQPKVSSYAPAGDLIAQVDYFVKHAGEALADKSGYDEAKQAAVERDSNTLAVLAMLLAMHDEDHKLKAAAPAILKASQSLAEHYEDYDASVGMLAEVRKSIAGEGPAGGPVSWDAVGDLTPLMEQVPIVQAPMKRGATDARRLKRQAALTAGQAATLAAIAQATSFVTDYATDEQLPEWEKYCVEMRDACAAVNTAVRGGDAAKAAEAIVALQKSCDDCHAAFKDE